MRPYNKNTRKCLTTCFTRLESRAYLLFLVFRVFRVFRLFCVFRLFRVFRLFLFPPSFSSGTRCNKQNREMEETVIVDGSTYLILLVLLNIELNLLGRFLMQSIASKLVSGLYERTIPFLLSCEIFTAAVLSSVSRYTLNETLHFSLSTKSER